MPGQVNAGEAEFVIKIYQIGIYSASKE